MESREESDPDASACFLFSAERQPLHLGQVSWLGRDSVCSAAGRFTFPSPEAEWLIEATRLH
jgi:hypothetical protein